MLCVLFAERAILGHCEPVGVVTLIFVTVVVAVFALRTLESYLGSHVCFLSHLEKLRTKKLHPQIEC